MVHLAAYLVQLGVIAALLGLAVSIYFDGLGYTVFHLMAIAGLGAYSYAILTTSLSWSPWGAAATAVGICAIAGAFIAEALRSLRGDGLTLATFGAGIGSFELFRYSAIAGGVFGIGKIPALDGGNPIIGATIAVAILLLAVSVVLYWRRSTAGRAITALRMDEWGAVSIGISLGVHQRISGLLAGGLSGLAGLSLASSANYIEPRDFQPASLLLPLASVVVAGGRTPFGVIVTAAGIVLGAECARVFGESAVVAGPLTDITLAVGLGVVLVATRIRQERRQYVA